MPRIILNHDVDGWREKHWDDGTEQFFKLRLKYELGKKRFYAVERVRGHRPWCVVDRGEDDQTLLPPVVSGPFEDLEGAKAAYIFICSLSNKN